MRTKVLLLAAAALSAGALAASAQVYSANVVGYVNTTFGGGNTLFCNPLRNTTNDLNTLIPSGNDGMTLSRWDNANAKWLDDTATFYANNGVSGPGVWDASPGFGSPQILPGEGLMLNNPGSAFVNTFVGDVLQGTINVPIPSGASMLGSPVPIGGDCTNVLQQLTLNADFDCSVSKFDKVAQQWGASATYYGAAVPGGWDPANLQIAVGEGFLLLNGGPATTWVRTFTVQ